MKRRKFELESSGFYGVYWPIDQADTAIIAMIGDDSEDYLARISVKWLHKQHVNVMTMSPGKKDYGHHNYPLERIEVAIKWLKQIGNKKIGIVGASTTGTLALTAASYFKDITLTIALTPSDFIWQGFMQGKKDGCKEWPIEGESLFSYKGQPLDYMPFAYKHPEYWHEIEEETKHSGNMLVSKKLFDDSEKAHPLTESQMIKVENIQGQLVLIGAKDDTLWDTVKYINRIQQRLLSHPHTCHLNIYTYEYGTHFVFPQSMIKMMLPIGSSLFMRYCFKSATEHSKQCLQTRVEIDENLTKIIRKWHQ